MRDQWYGDSRDLVKWSVLIRLAEKYRASVILQIAYLRRSKYGPVIIDGEEMPIPSTVLRHFRSINNIERIDGPVPVKVFGQPFTERVAYLAQLRKFIAKHSPERKVVFLDPDTGLESGRPSLNHVLDAEVRSIWQGLPAGDVLVFYQHQPNRNGQPWIEPKKAQFAQGIGVENENVRIAFAKSVARDVAFFFAQKT